MMIREKKGGERILWPYWILMMVILGGGIIAGTTIVRNPTVNIRDIESGLLVEKALKCFFDGEELSEKVYSSDFDLIKNCKFNFDDISGDSQYYLIVEVYEYEKCDDGNCVGNQVIFNGKKMKFDSGDPGLFTLCEIAKKGKGVPACSTELVYFVKDEKRYFMSVKGVVNKAKQNVR